MAVVEAGALDLLQMDRVGLPQDLKLLLRDVARSADGEAGAGKGMAAHPTLRQDRLATELACLVLTKFAQRLHQPHAYASRQAADIVPRLDRDAVP